jgi:proline dehydrogenase
VRPLDSPRMLAAALRAFFLWLSERRWMARLALRTPLIRRMPLRFVAGTTLGEAIAAVRALNATGAMATLDVLGESVTDRPAAERAAAAYIEAIERIAAEGLDANVSLKLTQMGIDLGVDACLEVIRPVVEAGNRHGIFVRVDMEGSAYTDRTLDVVQRLRSDGHDVGPVIQAYLHRSPDDVETLAAERVRTRICKGAYAEPPEIALQDREEIGAAFVALCDRLLAADTYPAAATHDPEMIDGVAARAAERGIGPDRFEFQLLYGIRRDLQRLLIERGHRVRIYVPFGTEWWSYFMRRLAERPANVLFVLRSLFGERA